jgi:hypothetical protein
LTFSRAPRAPIIISGAYKGRAVNDLSDDELKLFLKGDALGQTQPVINIGSVFPSYTSDFSHYWCGKYEIVRRKLEVPSTSGFPRIEHNDPAEGIVEKLFAFGFRRASFEYHPDRSGSAPIMQAINAAREIFREMMAERKRRSGRK